MEISVFPKIKFLETDLYNLDIQIGERIMTTIIEVTYTSLEDHPPKYEITWNSSTGQKIRIETNRLVNKRQLKQKVATELGKKFEDISLGTGREGDEISSGDKIQINY